MRATRTFTDKTGVMRKNGEEWLIKMEDTEAHIPDVYEEASQNPFHNRSNFTNTVLVKLSDQCLSLLARQVAHYATHGQ